MQKLKFFVLLTVLLAISSGLAGQPQGTVMLHMQPRKTLAILIQSKHTTTDFLQSAEIKNVGSEPIVGYRMGWVAVYPSGKDKVGLGESIDVPLGVAPGASTKVPAQGVSPDYAKEGAVALVFFVAEVRTSKERSGDSLMWRPAIEEIEQQAIALAKSETSLSGK
jgi:hypothetical protein